MGQTEKIAARRAKRPGRMLALLCLAALLCLPARAASYGGAEDFYNVHSSQCVSDGHSYYTNGARGYVTVYTWPGSGEASDYLLNENVARIRCTWQDGQGARWGLLSYESLGRGAFRQDGGEENLGWIAMSELVLKYDKEQFVRDHLEEFVMEPVTLDMRDYETVYLWRYPGCGGTAELATWYIRTEADNVLRFPAYWLDSRGRRWGGYSFFESDGFICLDEPGLEENLLPEVEQAGRIVPAADGRTLPRVHVPGSGKNTALWAAGGGLTLLLGLAAFFALRKKPGKKPVKKGRG